MTNQVSVSVVVQSSTGLSQITSTTIPQSLEDTMNLTICLIGTLLAVICICRMNALSMREHKLHVRLHYLFLFVGSISLAGAPWFWPSRPMFGVLAFLVSVVISILLSTSEWTRGAPSSVCNQAVPEQLELLYDEKTDPISTIKAQITNAVYHINRILRGD